MDWNFFKKPRQSEILEEIVAEINETIAGLNKEGYDLRLVETTREKGCFRGARNNKWINAGYKLYISGSDALDIRINTSDPYNNKGGPTVSVGASDKRDSYKVMSRSNCRKWRQEEGRNFYQQLVGFVRINAVKKPSPAQSAVSATLATAAPTG